MVGFARELSLATVETVEAKILGTWEHTKALDVREGAVFVHAGIYSFFDDKGLKTKTCGFRIEAARDFMMGPIIKAWQRNQLAYAGARKGRAALGDKHRPMPRLSGVLMQAPKRAQLIASDWVRGGLAELGAPHVQFLLLEINGAPIKRAGFRDPQPVPEHDEYDCRVPGAPPVAAGGLHEPENLIFGKVLALAIGRIRLATAACCDRASLSIVDSK